MGREASLEYVVTTLLPKASLLARLLIKQADWTVTRTEGSVLATLSRAPQRITALADLEGLAQPTVTIMVKRLEEHGWVQRSSDPDDKRVVLVSITDAGREALEHVRQQYRALLREHLAGQTDEQIADLERATRTLAELADVLQSS
jgi:DNA-binding MarR family transcriptional regulator